MHEVGSTNRRDTRHKGMSMKWEAKGDNIYGATKKVSYQDRYTGALRVRELPFRIDGRGGTYRVDLGCYLTSIWEAIDGGKPFATRREAEVYVSSYISSIVLEGELCTSLVGKRAYGEAA